MRILKNNCRFSSPTQKLTNNNSASKSSLNDLLFHPEIINTITDLLPTAGALNLRQINKNWCRHINAKIKPQSLNINRKDFSIFIKRKNNTLQIYKIGFFEIGIRKLDDFIENYECNLLEEISIKDLKTKKFGFAYMEDSIFIEILKKILDKFKSVNTISLINCVIADDLEKLFKQNYPLLLLHTIHCKTGEDLIKDLNFRLNSI